MRHYSRFIKEMTEAVGSALFRIAWSRPHAAISTTMAFAGTCFKLSWNLWVFVQRRCAEKVGGKKSIEGTDCG